VVKHSGAERFDVDLRAAADRACLTIRDTGRGFDPPDAIRTRGLGLVSMRERLNLVGGTLSIRSKPARGTEIFAEVPLPRVGTIPLAVHVETHS
jgi:two-component system sensor histidine kinase DegS